MKPSKIFVSLSIIVVALAFSGCSPQNRPKIRDRDSTNNNYTAKPVPKKQGTLPILSTGLNGKVIIIDAGHGGKDPGAGGVGFSQNREKVLALSIATKLEAELKTRGAKVIMTRKSDVFLELDERARFADKYAADLLVSIHCDAHNDPKVKGATVYIARQPNAKSKQIAEQIRRSFTNNNIYIRGVRNANFRVLVKHSRPSVLIENGYLTNREDAARLNNSWYQKKLAKTIAEGIEKGL